MKIFFTLLEDLINVDLFSWLASTACVTLYDDVCSEMLNIYFAVTTVAVSIAY